MNQSWFQKKKQNVDLVFCECVWYPWAFCLAWCFKFMVRVRESNWSDCFLRSSRRWRLINQMCGRVNVRGTSFRCCTPQLYPRTRTFKVGWITSKIPSCIPFERERERRRELISVIGYCAVAVRFWSAVELSYQVSLASVALLKSNFFPFKACWRAYGKCSSTRRKRSLTPSRDVYCRNPWVFHCSIF